MSLWNDKCPESDVYLVSSGVGVWGANSVNTPTVVHDAGLDWETWDDEALVAQSPMRWKTLLSAERTPTAHMTMGLGEIPPGEQLLRHRHAEAETYYILAGRGEMHIDDEVWMVDAGAAVFIPGNAHHALHNAGDVPLRFLYAFAVNSFGDVEYQFDGEI